MPKLVPKEPLGGNTLCIYIESDGLLWAWGRDAITIGTLLKLPIRTAQQGKVVTKFICFRYKGDPEELQQGLHSILPYNIALVR